MRGRPELAAQEVDQDARDPCPRAAPTGTGGRSDRRPCRPCRRRRLATIAVRSIAAGLPRNQLRPLEGEQVALVSAVARVVVLVAVDHHVRLGHHARRRVAFLGRLRDVHALRQPLADARVGGRHRPIGRAEALDVREEHVAEQVAALQQRRRRDPGAAAGPAGDVRRIEQRLAQAAGHAAEVGNRRHLAQAHLLVGRDDQVHRALDLRRVRRAGCRNPSRGRSASAAASSDSRCRGTCGPAPP